MSTMLLTFYKAYANNVYMDSENKQQNVPFQPDALGVIGSTVARQEAPQPSQEASTTLVGRVEPLGNGEHQVVYDENAPLTAEQLGFMQLGRPAVPSLIDPESLQRLGR